MKKYLQIARRNLLISIPVAVILFGMLSIMPLPDTATAGMAGKSVVRYGVPFSFLTETSRSIPGGSTETKFNIAGLIANIIISYGVVILLVTLAQTKKVWAR